MRWKRPPRRVLCAFRKLGRASFKGIGKLVIFEIVDPEPWDLSLPPRPYR